MSDEIERAALDAALHEFRRDDRVHEWTDTARSLRAAIRAYEAAMWQDAADLPPHHGHTVMMKCTSGRTGVAICVWERASDAPSWHWADVGINEPGFPNRVVPDRYRPLPKPPEGK